MGLLGLSMVKPEIIPAGCLQPFVAEDVFDVTHGTTVEKQSSGRSMTQDVRCDALGNTGHRPVPAKRRQISARFHRRQPSWVTNKAG